MKQALMQYLEHSAYVKLAPSRIDGAGVGVVALRAIPRGVDPFGGPNPELRPRDDFVIPLQRAELARLPNAVRAHALSFFPQVDEATEVFGVPATGFAAFDASWYVNHADEANVAFTPPDDEPEADSGFVTVRAIAEGEELVMDYKAAFPDLHARLLSRLRGGCSSSVGAATPRAASARLVARRRGRPELCASSDDDAAKRERLRQLFGDDFKDAEAKELSRVPPTSQLNEPPPREPAAARGESPEEEEAALGRRVRQQQRSSDLEQLVDVGARFAGLFTLIDGVRRGGLWDASIVPGRICIARRDFPSKYIVRDQAYEVVSIYYQGLRGAEVERVPVDSLDARRPEGCSGYVLYMSVFSEEYHAEPVTVRPEEVGLVSMGEEVADALKIGVPILGFWLAVISFLLTYGAATK